MVLAVAPKYLPACVRLPRSLATQHPREGFARLAGRHSDVVAIRYDADCAAATNNAYHCTTVLLYDRTAVRLLPTTVLPYEPYKRPGAVESEQRPLVNKVGLSQCV